VSGYTIKNIKDDVEDQAAKHGLSPDLEARFVRGDLGLAQVGLSYQRLQPGATQPFGHRHGQDEEVYVVIGGSGRMKLGDEVVDIRRWDAIRVAPETFRSLAAGDDGLEVLAIGPATSGDAQPGPSGWNG
jgi:uncharacterized cupin superfamily protein